MNVGIDQRRQGHHDGAQQQREGELAAPEGELREPVAGQHREHRRTHAAGEGVEGRVADPLQVDAAVVGEQLLQVADEVDGLG